MNATTYTIPAANLDELQSRIDTLNKRARRIGVAEIQMTSEFAYREHKWIWTGTTKGHWSIESDIPIDAKATGAIRDWLTLAVTGEAPQYAGWRLIGVLEPISTDDGSENIIQSVPGYDVPAEYRERVGQCDHCRTSRRRNETFVVLHDDGSTKMVGRQCLKDFLGHADPHQLAAWAELLCELSGVCQDAADEDWLGGGCREANAWSLDRFLTVTSAVIRHDGWLGRGKARELSDATMSPISATADRVLSYLSPIPESLRSRKVQEWLDEIAELMAQPIHDEQSKAAIEWALSLEREGLDDYLYNLNLIARAGYANTKTAGLAASMIVAYRRANDLEIEGSRKAPRPESNHVGTIGKRQEFTVTCEKIFESDGYYGVTGIHRLVDESGNDLVWFASGSAKWLEVGETYRVKATPKEHGDYKGRPQTVVNRVAIME